MCLQLSNLCSDQQANYKVRIINIGKGSIVEMGPFDHEANRNPHVELKISLEQEQMYSCAVVMETEVGIMTSEIVKFSESVRLINRMLHVHYPSSFPDTILPQGCNGIDFNNGTRHSDAGITSHGCIVRNVYNCSSS